MITLSIGYNKEVGGDKPRRDKTELWPQKGPVPKNVSSSINIGTLLKV